jgi:hypothetical protein
MTPTERARCEFYTTGGHDPSECKHYYPDLDPFQCGRCGLFLPFEFPLCAADELKIDDTEEPKTVICSLFDKPGRTPRECRFYKPPESKTATGICTRFAPTEALCCIELRDEPDCDDHDVSGLTDE